MSAFVRKDKQTAWAVCRVYPNIITEPVSCQSVNTDTIGAENAAVIERLCAFL